MSDIRINYNPYTLRTDITIDGNSVDDTSLVYVKDKRLQEWIEPRGQWEGIFQELRKVCNERTIKLSFYGTSYDYEDMVYAYVFYRKKITHKAVYVACCSLDCSKSGNTVSRW